MPVLVHLAPEPLVARILKNGIRRSGAQGPVPGPGPDSRGAVNRDGMGTQLEARKIPTFFVSFPPAGAAGGRGAGRPPAPLARQPQALLSTTSLALYVICDVVLI